MSPAQERSLLAPVTTPFDADGEIALDRMAEQVSIYRSLPLAGLIVFGTSGEGLLLEPDEETPILDTVRKTLGADRRMIVQVGRESVRATLNAADRAVAAGADALLCLPPRYYGLRPEIVERHYRALAAATNLPVFVYHIPMSKVELEADFIATLALDGVLAGIKDSYGDLDLEAHLLREAGAGFEVFCGKASTVAAALARGAHGAILAVADVVPERVLELFDAHAEGDQGRVDEIQRSLLPLAEVCGPRFGIPGIKAALDLRGWPGGGSPRAPMAPLADGDRAEVAAALSAAGIET